MRSRPDLKVYLSPGEPAPGTRLHAEVVLQSRSETPIDGVEVHLGGIEQRHAGTSVVGNVPVAQFQSRRLVDLAARTAGTLLTKGEHRFRFAFDLPKDAPPRYRSNLSMIEYDLHVRVSIPWWPDRSARFAVPVAARPRAASGAPGAFCTDARGPEGAALYMEASVESATVPVGGVIRGAVSLANVAHHRVRRVDLALVHAERMRSGGAVTEVQRYLVSLHEGAPKEGEPLPFQVALPAGAAPSFAARFFEVRWFLEIRAVITLGSDVSLSIPFEVIRAAEGASGPMPLARVPPVGRERRALLWAESARKNGLDNDVENERMSMDLGAVSLAVTLEPRKAGGLALTAAVAWPRLGIDLAVAERRWVDAWSGGTIAIDAPGFADRFTVRGREASQVQAFLDEASCRWLLLFDEAAVGDEGATLVSSGAAQTLPELDAFVARAVGTARALAGATERVPPPSVMAACLPAWRAFAALLGGRLSVGEMSIDGAVLEEAQLVLATEWSREGAPIATVVRFPLPEREGPAASPSDPRALDGTSRALVESLTPKLTSLDLGEHAVEARLPAPVDDPATLEPILSGLAHLARRLSGGAARGPYR